ncbi:hypothetical protein PS623_04621 [Pseudomonas fluorescens]|uniref:hypothetical protein n=1 Tax=Pseudomonas fluorescens TaxID=294 RepID=UPI0012408668|nr:hypothetical protein [Pseudomonas fluorescens]VVN27711.1 hypothetical protein PS623_04621 [Pseudomonas fluorescens]
MLNDPPSYFMVGITILVLFYCYHVWQEAGRKGAERLRQWVLEVNTLAEQHGHPDLAGSPDDPYPDYVKRFEAGETPAQVIAAYFGRQQSDS